MIRSRWILHRNPGIPCSPSSATRHVHRRKGYSRLAWDRCLCHAAGETVADLPLPSHVKQHLSLVLGATDVETVHAETERPSRDPATPLVSLTRRILHSLRGGRMPEGQDQGRLPDDQDQGLPGGLGVGVTVVRGPACIARSVAYLIPALDKVSVEARVHDHPRAPYLKPLSDPCHHHRPSMSPPPEHWLGMPSRAKSQWLSSPRRRSLRRLFTTGPLICQGPATRTWWFNSSTGGFRSRRMSGCCERDAQT